MWTLQIDGGARWSMCGHMTLVHVSQLEGKDDGAGGNEIVAKML